MEKRTRYQNIILAILAVMTIAFGALLFFNQARPGIQFRDAFLKQSIDGNIETYSGECKGKDVAIKLTKYIEYTAVEIAADESSWSYIVTPLEEQEHNAKEFMVTDDSGKLLFRGLRTPVGYLLDENGDIDVDNMGIVVTWGDEARDEWANYEPSVRTILNLADGPEVIRRGSIGLYFLMIFLTFLVALDVLFPELFFQLRHILSVRDPEPSDFYIAVQRLNWAVSPVLLAVGYGFAATMLP